MSKPKFMSERIAKKKKGMCEYYICVISLWADNGLGDINNQGRPNVTVAKFHYPGRVIRSELCKVLRIQNPHSPCSSKTLKLVRH